MSEAHDAPRDEASDLLYGVKEIAAHVRRSHKATEHLIAKNLLPSFKLGGIICSTKSAIAKHFAEKLAGEGAR